MGERAAGGAARRYAPRPELALLRVELTAPEERLVEELRAHVEHMDGVRIILEHVETAGRYASVAPAATSRYTAEGRAEQCGRIRSRLAVQTFSHACALTLTIDPSRWPSRWATWEGFAAKRLRFFDRLRRWLRRQGREMPAYVWAVEEQPGTGNPHLHVLFDAPWLAPKDRIDAWWGEGPAACRVERARHTSIHHYISKALGEVAKQKSWSALGLAYVWRFRMRMWGVSQDLRAPAPPEEREWQPWGVYVPGVGLRVWIRSADGRRIGLETVAGGTWDDWEIEWESRIGGEILPLECWAGADAWRAISEGAAHAAIGADL